MSQIIDALTTTPDWEALQGNVVGLFEKKQILYDVSGRAGGNITMFDGSFSMIDVPHKCVVYFVPDKLVWQRMHADIRGAQCRTLVADVVINVANHMSEATKGLALHLLTDGLDNCSTFDGLPDGFDKSFEGAVSY